VSNRQKSLLHIPANKGATVTIHLVQAKNRLIEGQDQTTLCGREMKSTVLRAMFEDDGTAPIVEDVRWSENVCSKCVEGVWRDRFFMR
jgi:hypothetical protein